MDSEWIPTVEQTQVALVHILNYITNIKANTEDMRLIDSSEDILKNISDYGVQFKGIIKENKQIIYCNFFPKKDTYFDWKDHLVSARDGGFWYWQIEYDLQSEQCVNFRVNENA